MARKSSGFSFLADNKSLLRQSISAILSWAMIMSTLPAYSSTPAQVSRLAPSVRVHPLAAPAAPRAASLATKIAAPKAVPRLRGPKPRLSVASPLMMKTAASGIAAASLTPNPLALLATTPAVLSRLAALATPSAVRVLRGGFLLQSGGGSNGNLAVSVGYGDNLRANPDFPVPWQGSPNTLFLGSGPSFDAGAIRLDNLSTAPLTIDSVVVNLGRPGPTFNLWGSFTIPAQSSAILTQTGEFNFDTSDFPIVGCGQSLSPNETRIPTVTVTIGGVGNSFADTGHILDTGGFDLACQGNESLQWRPIGTTGIQNTSSSITLSPSTSIQAAGTAYTATALVQDAGNQPIANVVVDFTVLSGPNAGKKGSGTTNAQGQATFTYTSALAGTDILQASVTNAAGGSIQSEQVTSTWTSAGPCPPPAQPPAPGTPVLLYAGQNSGEFNDPLVLAAQLTDGTGNPLNGRALSFGFAGQAFNATTNGNGVAVVNIAAAPAPGAVPLSISFAGDGNFTPAIISTSVNIGLEETTIRYIGKPLLGTAAPQQVIALLTDSVEGNPVPNRTVTFTVGSVTAQAVTNSNGIATTELTLGPDQTSGPAALQVAFAGDSFYKPSLTGVPIIVYLSTSFVVWGGNAGGLRLGQDVNFWGHSWDQQVTGGNYNSNGAFKGFADPVDQIHVCEASAGSGGPLDDLCWSSKPGQSFPPPLTLPAYIEVIISTAISGNSTGEIFGNIAAAAVCQVDPTPAYGPDPGKPGFCKLVAIIEDGGPVFPPRPALIATQNQPPTVLPGQTYTVNAVVTNSSPTTAESVVVSENFDGVTPTTGSQSFASILNGQQETAGFQVTDPPIVPRQAGETTVQYEQRLAGVDGRLFTSTGSISFTDAVNEPFLPLAVSSFSRLQLPRLTLGISGPSCVGPGSAIPYKVTVSNIGSADAESVALVLEMPDGTSSTVLIPTIPVGTSVTNTINFVVPAILPKQPNETDQQYITRLQSIDGSLLTTLATATWQDAIGNGYGPIDQEFISITERVPIVITSPQGPTTVLPGTSELINFTTQNIGGGNASQVFLQVTNPDSSLFPVPPFALAGGQAAVATSSFTVPVVPAKQAGETDTAYLARLTALDNSPLNFIGQLNWLDASNNNYGPTHTAFASTEILPVLTIMLAGPPTANAGDKLTYTITLTNNGHAMATIGNLTITMPDGSVQNAVPLQSTLAPGASTTATAIFSVPISQQAGTLMATAQVTWTDANNNSYGPVSSETSTQVAGIPPTVLASCLPTSSLSVLLNPDKTVSSYVPNGTWGRNTTGVRFVPVEGTGSAIQISTPNGVNSCSSNSVTSQTVCTANNTDVYLLTGSTLNTTLKSSSNGTASFSGGGCNNCGVAINPVTNQAVIAMGLSGGAGIQFLDLNTNTFEAPIKTSTGRISEDISVDPGRGLILTPSEDSIYGLFKTDSTGTNFFTNRISPGGEFDSAAEDCTTGIALAAVEFTDDIFIADLTQATFTPGSPAGTWTAPEQLQNFPGLSLAAGTSGIAVAPGSHLGIVTGEFGGNTIGVFQLPATSGSGTPAILDWVLATLPTEPNGVGFSEGFDPHTVTAYVSPTSGKAFGLVADGGPLFLGVVDLQALLSAHRSGAHAVDPTVNLLATGIVRYIPTQAILTGVNPTTGKLGQQGLAVTISGVGTNFVQGTTTASFGAGITVTSVTVNSPTSAVATINIDPTTSLGARNVTVTTGAEVATLSNGFTVIAGPAALTQLSPNSGQQGQQGLSVTITGSATHFIQGSTSANFGASISVQSLTVSSPTSATAVVNIDPLASVAGRSVTVTTGGEQASGQVFNVATGPAKITQLSPNSAPQGAQGLSVTITGQSTHFQQNVTSANFGLGITVTSVTVISATRATAVLNIGATATIGPRNVTATTSGEVATTTNGFSVEAGVPVITTLNPNSGKQGQQNLSIALTGAFTHFVQGTTTANFGAGIGVASLTVTSPTAATAIINIDPAAATGLRNVTLTTGSETAALLGGFTVNPGTPVITQVNPNTGAVGQQNLSVIVTGQFTHFVQGSTSVAFGGIPVNSVTVNSPTSLTAAISIPSNFPAGQRTVSVSDPSEGISLANAFTVTTSPFLAQVSPNSAQQGTLNLSVTLIAQNTHFVQGTTTASFGAGVTVNSLTVNSATNATAVISVDPAATTGARDVTATTGTEVVTLTGGFTVLPPPPSVSTTLPEGTVITSPTPIIGSVNSGTWALKYALASADGTVTNPVFTTFASGTTAASNGTLGTLDPTVLLNGSYIILLTSTDQFGQTTQVSSDVNVQGTAKVGNFSLSFNDLSVPSPALPITITRTYDSRDKAPHDFGFGWTLSFVNVRVQKNGVLGANWQMTQSGGLLPNFCLVESRPHIVTITFPDNRVYKFEATTNPQCQQIAPPETVDVTFAQLPTTTGTQGATLQIVGDNSPLVNPASPGPVDLLSIDTLEDINPTVFQLTTAEGFVYVIDQTRGATSFTDPNGNTVSINPSGITSSTGKNIVFTRDTNGRITQIADPAGHTLKYSYGATGDLASFTDGSGNITTFSYDVTHLLLNIIDPRGVQAVKNTYDASGRLLSTTDPSGNTTTFAVNTSANQELITDRLGNSTLYEYDADGNVTRLTDPLGNVTTATYDANDNRLTETDALGKTTSFTYDASGNMLTQTDPLGNVTTLTYNSTKQILTVQSPAGNVTTNTYDSGGNMLTTTDAAGNVTGYTRSSAGLPLTTKNPAGAVTTNTYDASDYLQTQTDAAGNVTSFTYDGNGNRLSRTVKRTRSDGTVETLTTQYQYDGSNRLTVTTNPDSTTFKIDYNSFGKRSDTVDGLGRTTHYDYDLNGRLSKTTFPDGTIETLTYDADDHLLTKTDRAGRVTSYSYDRVGRLVKTTFADGGNTQVVYSAIGQPIRTIDALGNGTQFTYDDAGQRLSITDALSRTTTFAYDKDGNQVSVVDARGNTTQFVYDGDDRLIKTVFPDGTSNTVAYDAAGRQISTTDQAGSTRQFGYDALGQLVSVTDALSQVTHYAYDELGERISQADSNGHVTKYAYDQLGRRISRTLPLGMSESYSYDAAGNVTSKTDFNGHITQYSYDSLNRLTTKTADPFFVSNGIGAAQVTFTYTATGKRASMTDATGATAYTYDARDRLLTKTTPFGKITYTYDVAGNLLSIASSNPGGTSMAYSYDALNRLSSVTDPTGTTIYNYDPVGNLNSFSYPNGTSTNYTYDALNRLKRVQGICDSGTGCGTPGTSVSSYLYTLGPAGNRLSVAELSGRTVQYTYDAIYRLTSETIAGSASQSGAIGYSYDPVGNRLQRNSTVPAIPATGLLSYDSNDRTATDVYDNNGNLTNNGVGNIYDFENHLVQRGGVALAYDGDGNRVSKTVAGNTTNYLVTDLNPTGFVQVLEEVAAGSVVRAYSYGLTLLNQRQIVAGTPTTSFYGYDGHGSVRFLTDVTGAVTDTYDYDAFGNLVNSTGATPNNYLFAGEQFDPDLGLYYNRSRYLDVRLGRFINMDVYEGNSQDPLSLHKYLYVSDDPANLVDPSGNEGLADSLTALAINTTLTTLAISVPLRALQLAWKVAHGANLGAAAQEAALGVLTDVALSLLTAGLLRFASGFTVVRVAGEALTRAASSVWNLTPFARGWAIEELILGGARNLHPNFPVIDDFVEGVATSIKSLDLTAATYQSGSAIISRLSSYAAKLASFQGATYAGDVVAGAAIREKVLVVAFEDGAATIEQAQVLEDFLRIAKTSWPNIKIAFSFIP